MIIQLVGKVSGLPRESTLRKFENAEKMLKRFGHKVVNPMVIVPENADWHMAMKICFASLDHVDAIYLLNDWNHSLGAQLEVEHAIGCRKKILTFKDLVRVND